MILGLDVSHWNALKWADWPDRRFVYIKASEGTTWVDDKMSAHKAAAALAGKFTGPYHYFRAAFSGVDQANHFHATAGSAWDMPPAIDVEAINNAGFTKEVFGDRLLDCLVRTESLFGRKPMIYTSKSKWDLLVGNVGWEADYDLWVAHYTTASAPLIPVGWSTWRLWQYTSTLLDQNRFNGDEAAFLSWLDIAPPPPTGELEARVAALEAWKADQERRLALLRTALG